VAPIGARSLQGRKKRSKIKTKREKGVEKKNKKKGD
jgi:hypothetical protein